MVRPGRHDAVFFIVALVVFIESAVALALLHGTVVACTAGFRTSGNPLGGGTASQCLGYDVVSAVQVAISLVAGGALIWLGSRLLMGRLAPRPSETKQASSPSTDGGPSPRESSAQSSGGSLRLWVFVLIVAFFAASFFSASWEYLRLSLNNFQDVATNQQLLSSAILGQKPFPFYEAFNCGHHGQCSFLEVHTTFVAYPVAALYSIAPTAFTLFAVQSLALGLGALPLYAIAVDVLGSRRWSLAVAGAYLAWLPMFLGVFSFHWEAFIPVEMFSLFWLWSRGLYRWAIPVVLVSFVTIEVTPVLAFFVGLYFLWPWLVKGVRSFFAGVRKKSGASSTPPRKWFRAWLASIIRSLRVPEVYATLALMAASLAAYVLLRLFVVDAASVFGLPPVPAAYALPLNSPNKAFVFTLGALTTDWSAKLIFWTITFLTLGFLPLLAPRALLLVLPWLAFTSFNISPGFFHFGTQYVFVSTAAVFIAFTFGLNRAYRWSTTRPARPAPTSDGGPS